MTIDYITDVFSFRTIICEFQENRLVSRYKEEIEIYQAIRNHREHELEFLLQDMENQYGLLKFIMQSKLNGS